MQYINTGSFIIISLESWIFKSNVLNSVPSPCDYRDLRRLRSMYCHLQKWPPCSPQRPKSIRPLQVSNVDKPANCRGPEVSGVQSRLRWVLIELIAKPLGLRNRTAESQSTLRTNGRRRLLSRMQTFAYFMNPMVENRMHEHIIIYPYRSSAQLR